jgi:hypothetical protein
MTKVTTQRVLMRLGIGLLSIVVALVIGAIAAKEQIETRESGSKIFFPQRIAVQAGAVYQALHKPIADETVPFPCDSRYRQFLADLIAANETLNEEDALRRLHQLWNAAASAEKPTCSTFPYVLSTAYKAKATSPNASGDISILMKSLLAQNINWNSSIFCLYVKIDEKNYLAGKPNMQCLGSHPSAHPNADQRRIIEKLAPLITVIENRKFRLPKGKRIDKTLSLDLNLQLLLDSFLENLNVQDHDARAKRIDFLKNLRTAAVVILDADSSKLLAAACIGADCNTKDQKHLGLFAAASVEAPPASTAKLLFALAIADQNQGASEILPLELKTSGQLDNNVSKRNEWWEKQAICDGDKPSNCAVPLATASWASDIGWNKNCRIKPSSACGRSSLFSPLGIPEFNPVLGRLLVHYSRDGASIDVDNLKKPVLRWADYEAIRNGKKIAESNEKLPPTSLVVQSVIGAGNNRVSALGLAQLSAAIYQAHSTGVIYETTVFDTQMTVLSSTKKTSPTVVLHGMQKAVQPAEKKWTGDGTARAAFIGAFGMDCPKHCPVYAKTGTVSTQDSVFAGTTLLTAIVKSESFDKTLLKTSNPSRKNLAIGVIFRPKTPGGPHYASNLGMQFVKHYIHGQKYEDDTPSPRP